MKKLMTLGIAAFAFVATMGVASANFSYFPGNNYHPAPAVTVSNSNSGNIVNHSNTSALTGRNSASSHSFFGGGASIATGVASAGLNLQNQVGSNSTGITGAIGAVSVGNSNVGGIMNSTNTKAATGGNHAHALGGSAGVTSGSALSLADIMNVIGFNTTTVGN